MLRTTATPVATPRFPVIDAHNHLGSAFGGPWAKQSAAQLLKVLDQVGVETLVNLDGGFGDSLSRAVGHWQTPTSGRVLVFAGLDYDSWANDDGFGLSEANRLRDSAARGARGLKVWKTLGLRAHDPRGQLVGVDDERLDPLWATAAELRLPVLIHVGDPLAFFEPLDPSNERYEELSAHPDWHFWPTHPIGRPDAPGYPPAEELRQGLERLVARHPGTTFVAAHMASSAEDLASLGQMLDDHPNLSVDLAERIAELGRQPYSARRFFLRYADRVLFGLDRPPDPELYQISFRFLETLDESFDYGPEPTPRQGRWQIHGIGMPADVLRKVYRDNAARILGLG
jgi:predicted TIM-barrel fold metal-dependent hydrolase